MDKNQMYISRSSEKTIAFAKKFAKTIKPGTVLALEGNLGSGKTTFIKGIALGLGLHDANEVKSPTFVLMHVYPTRVPLYHFDLYRLDSLKEFESIGLEEFVNDPNAVICVEWAEKAKSLLPVGSCHISLEIVDDHSRKICIKGPGEV